MTANGWRGRTAVPHTLGRSMALVSSCCDHSRDTEMDTDSGPGAEETCS